MRYRVQRGLVEVVARSAVHDLTTRFSKVGGHIDFDADDAASARAELEVDMRVFDTGDRFEKRKLEGELDPDTYPTASFSLSRLAAIHEQVAGKFVATAVGQIRWRGKSVDVKVKGRASVDRRAIEAVATFELDVRALGVSPARFRPLEVGDVVRIEVSLRAVAA